MSISIIGPRSLTLPTSMGGDETVFGLVVVATTRGLYVEDVGNGNVKIRGITDTELVSIDIVKLLLSKGCEVTDYPVYFEVDDIKAEVPASLPNRTYSIPPPEETPEAEPTEGIHTWETWYGGMPGHEPREKDSKFYCSSANTWDKGSPVPASTWGSLTVLSQEATNAKFADQSNI